ncbi:MAG: hypothetical protein ACP5TL_00920 [Candidatus Micrarchaeia archaeon]
MAYKKSKMSINRIDNLPFDALLDLYLKARGIKLKKSGKNE